VTFFEYISVATSIVLALAVARTIDGLRSSLSKDRRYWVHVVWVAIKVTNPMTYWWLMWRFRDVDTWNIVSFMLALAWPVVLYLQVTGLVTRQPELITDWRAHFYSQRRWFFGANICLQLIGTGLVHLLITDSSADTFGIARLVFLTLSIVGFATDNAKAHGIIVVGIAITLVLGNWAQAFTPLSAVP
jgi:hypothetical protein